ncbi:hypothetical protein jhhlp_008233 [Lomentospora prolificans]|uniref:Uncharacterized protein n=1 Tax=Lomentospora prolificans TaxID=41688 RepID=A0A2N3MXG4_9PEZI|nr:hypothetical protein jhhlp_008233 [Lomentospora prolificans]
MIFQSAAIGGSRKTLTVRNARYNKLVVDVGCDGSDDELACLRHVPFDDLNAAIANCTKVPLLISINSDEGTFSQGNPVNTDEQVAA